MITLYDYLPSQNGYKVRLLFNHLRQPHATKIVNIFAGEGQRPEFLAKNPTGAVPVLELEDGRILTESNAILCYLAAGTPYLPADAWNQAQVMRWMFFIAYILIRSTPIPGPNFPEGASHEHQKRDGDSQPGKLASSARRCVPHD